MPNEIPSLPENILSPDEFLRRQNNFFMFFLNDTAFGQVKGKLEYFIRVQEEYPDLVSNLIEKITSIVWTNEKAVK